MQQDAREKEKFRDVVRRRITGIVLAVVMLALWLLQGWPLRIGLTAVMVFSMWEMYGAFISRGARPIRWIGMAYAVLSVPAYLYWGTAVIGPLTALFCMLGLAGVILRGEIDFDSAVATLFPLFYPGLLITLIFPLQDLSKPFYPQLATGLTLLVPLVNDLFAYEIGARFGSRPLAPVLSPKKTVEGAVAGLCASVVIAVVFPLCARTLFTYVDSLSHYLGQFPPLWQFAALGLVGGLAAIVGDLTASMVKRYCGIKDFGAIFPGHGGMLDRMDSVLFSGAVVFMYFAFISH